MSVLSTINSPDFEAAVKKRTKDGPKFLSVVTNYIKMNRDILDWPEQQVLSAILHGAAFGVLIDGKEGYIFKRRDKKKGIDRVLFDPMIAGIRKVLLRINAYMDTGIVYDGDEFDYALGDGGYILHKPAKLGTPRGDIIGAWATITIYTTTPPHVYREVMDREELDKIQRMSPSSGGPWSTHPNEMRRKTVGRRCSKQVPNLPDGFYEAESAVDVPDHDSEEPVDLMNRIRSAT
jgi:recombinational DNA repair protein RecT